MMLLGVRRGNDMVLDTDSEEEGVSGSLCSTVGTAALARHRKEGGVGKCATHQETLLPMAGLTTIAPIPNASVIVELTVQQRHKHEQNRQSQ
jgi:hypothetical protein